MIFKSLALAAALLFIVMPSSSPGSPANPTLDWDWCPGCSGVGWVDATYPSNPPYPVEITLNFSVKIVHGGRCHIDPTVVPTACSQEYPCRFEYDISGSVFGASAGQLVQTNVTNDNGASTRTPVPVTPGLHAFANSTTVFLDCGSTSSFQVLIASVGPPSVLYETRKFTMQCNACSG